MKEERRLSAKILTTYPIEDASRRLRIEPISEELQRLGYQVRTHELLDSWSFKHKNDGGPFRIAIMLKLFLSLVLRLKHLTDQCDVLVVHREAFPFFTPHMERMAVRHARLSLLDVDDAIYEEPTHRRDWRSRLRSPQRALEFKNMFDVISCGNRSLSTDFDGGSARVLIAPTCPPNWVWSVASATPEGCTILWTGSQSTLGSLQRVLPDILRACEDGDMILRVLGAKNIDELPNHPRLEAKRWTEDREREWLRRSAIGIMPLPNDSPWESGKSGYKAILYLCAGLHAFVSPVGVNTELAKRFDSVDCCADSEWYRKLVEYAHAWQESSVKSKVIDTGARETFNAQLIASQVVNTLTSVS